MPEPRAAAATPSATDVAPTVALADGIPDPLELPDVESEGDGTPPLWAVVFAGGIGTRFWPLSTPQRPKQVLPLVDERPLIADTVTRLAPLIPAERVLVLTSADIADAMHAAIPELPVANLLVEPRPLGTAAALAWGAHEVARRAGPGTVMCAMHADLAVAYPDAFRATLRRAGRLAADDPHLVVIGATPTRTETGFGYLHPGAPVDPFVPLAQGGACRVRHMVEKPHAALADTLIAEGALWNTGMYLWQAQVALEQLTAHTPEVRSGLPALAGGDIAAFGGLVASVSIERGLLERSDDVVVVPGDFGWDDVGTWAALRRVRALDDFGNGVMGTAHCIDATGNVVHADRGRVVLYGVSGMLVVTLDGITFVTSLERATELGPLLNALPGSVRAAPGQQP